jgi:hypothetical protein
LQFNVSLHYFERDQAALGVSLDDIDQYAERCKSDIKKLLPSCVMAACFLIRASRSLKIELTPSADKRRLGAKIVSENILQRALALDDAVYSLLESGAGDKPVSELNSEKLIREDMAAFLKAE